MNKYEQTETNKLPFELGSQNRSTISLSPALVHITEEVQRELVYLNLNTEKEIRDLVRAVSQRLGFELTAFELDKILAQIQKDQKPFGVLQELVDDIEVSDVIVCNHSKIVVQKARQNFVTHLNFVSQEAYEAFVEKLLAKAGTSYSTKIPIADGMLGTFARVHAVHKSIAEGGPYLTIRLNRFSNVSLEDLENNELAPKAVLAYLRALVVTGQTILIVGEVATGKTTLVRALAASIPTIETILVIEDTPEIQLEHPNVRYIRTREANIDGAGKISPAECIRGGMRMAMNRIIFGEMRDAEAAEAFIDVCASGHPGMSTLHAKSTQEALVRLKLFLGRIQRGTDRSVIEQQIATAVQVLVHIEICKETRKRRIFKITEVSSLIGGKLSHSDLLTYSVSDGKPSWNLKNRISLFRDKLAEFSSEVNFSNIPEKIYLN